MKDNRFDFEKEWDKRIEAHNAELREYNEQKRLEREAHKKAMAQMERTNRQYATPAEEWYDKVGKYLEK